MCVCVCVCERERERKQYKSSITKNHKITHKKIDDVPLKDYVASKVIFRFCARKKKHCGNTQRLMTLNFHNTTKM